MDYKKRSDVPVEYTWDLSSLYKDNNEWEKDYETLNRKIKTIEKYQNKILDSAENLVKTLDTYYDILNKIEKLYMYASIKHDEDLSVSIYSLNLNKAISLYSKYASISSFISPEIIKGQENKIKKYLKDKQLAKYKFLIKDLLKNKKHTLKEKEEELVSKLTANDSTYEKISSLLTCSTLDYGKVEIAGETVTITNSNYRSIMSNKDQKVRKECFTKMSNRLKEFSSIFGELLVSNMKQTDQIAHIRNYKSVLDMELNSSNITSKVVDNLYNVLEKRINVFQKYLKILKNNLGLDSLKYYDLRAEFLSDEISFSIEDAEMLITESTKIYGEEYQNIIKKAFKERWIDYASYKGKKAGAYCTCTYGSNPVVLTNFHGKFADVSAIAHELGHAVNFYLSCQNNYAHNYFNDIFVAEVASLTNEIILSTYVYKNAKNKSLKLAAIYNIVFLIQTNLFDAALEGELENIIYKKINNGEIVNDDYLATCIYNLRKKYYGTEVELDDNVKYMWAIRAHYYMPFYLFKYATGVSAAINIAVRILNNDEKMKKNYIKFLSKGHTDYPINLLKSIGVDITKESVISNAIDYFDYLLDEFNKESEK